MQIILGLVALASCWLSILALRDGGGGKKNTFLIENLRNWILYFCSRDFQDTKTRDDSSIGLVSMVHFSKF